MYFNHSVSGIKIELGLQRTIISPAITVLKLKDLIFKKKDD